MNNPPDLPRLAELIKARNTVEKNIAASIGQPVNTNTVGDYIASVIFNIALEAPEAHRGYDGKFSTGPLAGQRVVIQWWTKHENMLHLKTDVPVDYYLVLAGPRTSESPAHSPSNPWTIESVFLFNAQELLTALRERHVQIGSGTSVIGELWDRAQLYPVQHNTRLPLSEEQRNLFALFLPPK